MDGTTLCPHCKTRFKVTVTQLKAHQGLVRCGHCLQAFDARSGFIPDSPHPQLELTVLDNRVEDAPSVVAVEKPAAEESHPIAAVESASEPVSGEIVAIDEVPVQAEQTNVLPPVEVISPRPPEAHHSPVAVTQEIEHDDLDFTSYVPAYSDSENSNVAYNSEGNQPTKPLWTWLGWTLSFFLLLMLLSQAVYFLRADIAARFPDTKPILVSACKSLGCSVALPQKNDLMSIESSSLEADNNNAALITLTALLRNRASYPLAFPNLELTLNDRQDKPVARKIFKPAEYLPPVESEQTGLQGNHEINLKLSLDTTDLNPVGYRLLVFYPRGH